MEIKEKLDKNPEKNHKKKKVPQTMKNRNVIKNPLKKRKKDESASNEFIITLETDSIKIQDPLLEKNRRILSLRKSLSKSKSKKKTPTLTEKFINEKIEVEDSNIFYENKRIKYRVLCSIVTLSDDEKKIMKNLGISFIDDKRKKFDLLIMTRFKRTIKFLLAIIKGVPIVTILWLEESIKEKKVLEYNEFLLKDVQSEKQYKYNLQASLERRRNNKGFLNGFKIWIPNNIKPNFRDIKLLIKESEGEILHEIYKGKNKFCLNLMNENDEEIQKFIKKGYVIYSIELLYTGILKQQLEIDNFKFNEGK